MQELVQAWKQLRKWRRPWPPIPNRDQVVSTGTGLHSSRCLLQPAIPVWV